jgi:hypothetical protein
MCTIIAEVANPANLIGIAVRVARAQIVPTVPLDDDAPWEVRRVESTHAYTCWAREKRVPHSTVHSG